MWEREWDWSKAAYLDRAIVAYGNGVYSRVVVLGIVQNVEVLMDKLVMMLNLKYFCFR